MKGISQLVLLGLLASGIGSSPAQAQAAAQERKGFWFGGGLGYGSVIVTCDGCTGGREGGASGYLALGGTISPHFLLGGESDFWVKSEEGITLTIGTVTLTGYFYPSLTSGFFVKAGVGVAGSHAAAEGQSVDHEGLGGLVGVGYDIPVGRTIAIVPYATWNLGSLGSVGESGTMTQNTLQVGLAIKIP